MGKAFLKPERLALELGALLLVFSGESNREPSESKLRVCISAVNGISWREQQISGQVCVDGD